MLARRIKGRRIKSKITHLYHPHTKENRINPQDIANAFSIYYGNLYNTRQDPSTFQPSKDDINTFLNQIKLPILTESQLTYLNNPFTENEIQMTSKTLPAGKAPGPDGLSGENYKQFSDI